jgi:hypothetical protein
MASDHLDDDTYIYFLPIPPTSAARRHAGLANPLRRQTLPGTKIIFYYRLTGATNIDVVHCCFD